MQRGRCGQLKVTFSQTDELLPTASTPTRMMRRAAHMQMDKKICTWDPLGCPEGQLLKQLKPTSKQHKQLHDTLCSPST
jgi:hypothetical protein